MKIAVTGASGAIGKDVLEAFKADADVEIIAITRGSGANGGSSCEEDGTGVCKVTWASTDYSVASLTEIFAGVEAVIHLAAVRGTQGVIADYHVNETLTENVLIAMGEAGVKRIVFASTIAVYSDTSMIPWKETDALTPKTLYGISKAACEHLCAYYAKKYGFNYCIIRIGQVVSLNEKRRAMMNVFIDLAREGKELRVIGRSVAKRQYVFCKDVAAVMRLLALGCWAEGCGKDRNIIVNVGMEEAHTNLGIAETVNRVFGNSTPINYESDTPETIEPSAMDVTVLKEQLGYTPLTLEETLRLL